MKEEYHIRLLLLLLQFTQKPSHTAKPSRKGTRQGTTPKALITPHKTTTPSVSKVSAKAPGGAALRRVAPRLFFHLEQFKISSIYESLTNWSWI